MEYLPAMSNKDPELENLLNKVREINSTKKKRGKQSRFTFTKEDLQRVVNELESNGTFPTQVRLCRAIERTDWAKNQKLKASTAYNFIQRFKIQTKTQRRRRRSLKIPAEAPSSNSKAIESEDRPTEPSPPIESKQPRIRPSGTFALKKFEQEEEIKLSKRYAEALGANGRIIFIKAGPPYFWNLRTDNVEDWVKLNMNSAVNQGLLLYPTAIFHLAQQIWPSFTKEYDEIKQKICEYFVNHGLGEFIGNG